MTKATKKQIEAIATDATATIAAQRGLPKVICNPTEDQLTVLATMTTSSAKIRYLSSEGYSSPKNMYSGIANYLGLRTQHVRNVLTQPLKKVATTA